MNQDWILYLLGALVVLVWYHGVLIVRCLNVGIRQRERISERMEQIAERVDECRSTLILIESNTLDVALGHGGGKGIADDDFEPSR